MKTYYQDRFWEPRALLSMPLRGSMGLLFDSVSYIGFRFRSLKASEKTNFSPMELSSDQCQTIFAKNITQADLVVAAKQYSQVFKIK